MKVSTNKTETLTVCKGLQGYKLEIQVKMIEQVMSLKYLGVEITSNGTLQSEVKHQAYKGSRLLGCLNDIMWKNKCLRLEPKVRICKSII
jgi:hypothetical protein